MDGTTPLVPGSWFLVPRSCFPSGYNHHGDRWKSDPRPGRHRMSVISVSVKHGQALDEARTRLRSAVGEVNARFAMMVQRVDWAADGNAVRLTGRGFEVDMRLDPEHLHVTGNLTFLGGLLAGPFATGLKQILQKTFPKRLT